MTKRYTVSQDNGGKWYAHKAGFANIPVMGSFGTKANAIKFAAGMMAISVSEYHKLR